MLIAIIGPNWLGTQDDGPRRLDDPDDWVRLEVEAAISRGIRVIPVLVDGARMPVETELPQSLRGLARRQAVTLNPASLDIRGPGLGLHAALSSEESPPQERAEAPISTQPAQLRESEMHCVCLSR